MSVQASQDGPVRLEELEDGALWRAWLSAPKANILDAAMIRALTSVFERAAGSKTLKAVVIEGEGKHFSFGASVQEHLPDQVAEMLRTFHGLFRTMFDSRVVTLGAVRGQCLGGGLELVSFCHRIFAAPGAKLGQPEIVLGVIAPAASVFLPERIGRGAAEDLCLSGRSIDAQEALRVGLVDEIAEDPGEAAVAYAREHLLPRSASSLRHAVAAVRRAWKARFVEEIERTERLYLDELMATHDAEEGIRAFVEKRSPEWKNE